MYLSGHLSTFKSFSTNGELVINIDNSMPHFAGTLSGKKLINAVSNVVLLDDEVTVL